MDAQEMKDAARRWISGVWDGADYSLIREMTSEGYTFTLPREVVIPREGLPDLIETYRASIPDLRNTIHEQLVDGNVVVTKGTTFGTHTGPFGDLTPTGKPIVCEWVMFTRFEGDRIVEDWEIFDEFGVMVTMGAVPDGG
jgi:hypothetical protein